MQGTKPLLELAHLNLSSLQKLFKQIQIIGVSDVKNTLLGPRSSAKVFGPQKGASPAQVKMIDKAMCKWAQAIQKTTGRKISHQPGTAAAGAIAAGLAGCFGAELISGSQFLIQKTHVEKSIQQADLIITSEGKLDRQTFYGKAPLAILKLAKKYRKKVLFICGQLEEKSLRNEPLAPTQVAVLTDFALSAQDAQENAAKYVRRVLKNI